MRHTRTWLFFFLPFLYVAIVLGLVAFQFSKKSDSFSQSLGDLTISGKTSTGGQPADLALRGRGLEFVFDSSHFLQTVGLDGTSSRVRPVSWTWKDGNAIVSFEKGLQLAFEKSEGAGRSLLIRPVANDALTKIAQIRIPFGPQNGARFVRSARPSLLEVVRDKSVLLASVDGAQDRIEVDNTFVLAAGKSGFRPARLDPLAPNLTPELGWLTLDETGDAPAAEAALSQYWDKAYLGWSSATSFSTRLADAWAQEALIRGEYPSAISRIQTLLSRDRREWGFDAVSFLGNVVELTAQQRRTVEAASSRSQPDWAGQGRLWLDAKLYGPEGSADRVKELLLTGKIPEGTPALLAFFQNLKMVQVYQPGDLVETRIQDVLKVLLGRVVRREGELYVQSADGLLDLRSSLVLGRLWLDHAKTLSNEHYGTAGARLVLSALSHLDAGGRLPEILVTQDGQIIRQEGTILPEELYATVRPAPVSETEVSGLAPGAFVRTPAKLIAQTVTADQARFSFRFPAGSAEHIVLSGVPAFDHVTMHGIRWRTDPQFQSYTDGWSYSASTKTLYVKIKHREDLEELVVHFQPER